MRKAILSITITITTLFSFAQDSVSVLFIGNSYTYVNNLPQMLEDLAASKGDIVFSSAQTAGGATFQYHAGNLATYNAIQAQPWDYVVLQAQSQEPSFPDSQVDTQTLPYAMQLADSIYANNFCSEVLYFLTWGRENGDPQWLPISTYDGMQARLRSAYLRFADSTQGSVSPVGAVWKYVRDNHPAIQLYSADESHPSVAGSYLAACTFYTSVFRKSPVGATYYSSLSAGDATILQQAVQTMMIDSLDVWNLRPIDQHTQAEFDFTVNGDQVEFDNLSTKATDYVWNFQDGSTSNEVTPIHTYTANGSYDVQLIAISPCDSDTVSYTVEINALDLNEYITDSGLIKKVTTDEGQFYIETSESIIDYQVLNMEGRVLIDQNLNGTTLTIDARNFPVGQYLLILKGESEAEVYRFTQY